MHNTLKLLVLIAVILLGSIPATAQDKPSLTPPEGFTAFDTPNDDGKSISVVWEITEAEQQLLDQEKKLTEQYKKILEQEDKLAKSEEVDKNALAQARKSLEQDKELFEQHKKACGVYILWISTSANGPWIELNSSIMPNLGFKSDAPQYFSIWKEKENKNWHFYEFKDFNEKTLPITSTVYFKLALTDGSKTLPCPEIVSATAKGNLFDTSKINVLIFVAIFCILIMYFISVARKNPNLFIRHIPGLDAIEETIGRATEMGRPILYLNGLLDMSSLSTIAATSILGKVARKVANYDSQIMVPCYDPIVMSVCQEVVKESYIEAGRPDAFKQDNIFYITTDQFAYAAAVDGIIIRHKPAANFYMGYYYAESLLIAETGAATGAMQIAGTDAVTQLPFFITTCDYTLMGEELYAASAYLSREPMQLGSLKGQDFSKGFIIIILVVGAIASTFGVSFFINLFKTF